MYVAELRLHEGLFLGASAPAVHVIGFIDREKCWSEYHRVCELMEKKTARANDLPERLEVSGVAGNVSIPLENLRGVSLCDYALENENRRGLEEEFPNLFRKPTSA